MSSKETSGADGVFDVVVVGGGVVGLAILRAVALAGYHCAVIEKEPHLLHWASGSNSGIVCTGVDAAVGTLERALIRDSIAQMRLYCRDMNIPTRPCGSLVCQWLWDEEKHLPTVLAESVGAGDSQARILDENEVLTMERNLNPSCQGAVHIPGEVVMDPWLYSVSLAVHARQNGARIYTNFTMDTTSSTFDGNFWTIAQKNVDGTVVEPTKLMARAVVNAAGMWADLVQTTVSREVPWTSQPRRGQYRVFASTESTQITHPVQPVPTQRTKGIFVFSTLYDQIVVGPTALDQESRTDRTPDARVSEQLEAVAHRILPKLDSKSCFIGDYVGIRPGTNKRDYQVYVTFEKRWIACCGIRSTGTSRSRG